MAAQEEASCATSQVQKGQWSTATMVPVHRLTGADHAQERHLRCTEAARTNRSQGAGMHSRTEIHLAVLQYAHHLYPLSWTALGLFSSNVWKVWGKRVHPRQVTLLWKRKWKERCVQLRPTPEWGLHPLRELPARSSTCAHHKLLCKLLSFCCLFRWGGTSCCLTKRCFVAGNVYMPNPHCNVVQDRCGSGSRQWSNSLCCQALQWHGPVWYRFVKPYMSCTQCRVYIYFSRSICQNQFLRLHIIMMLVNHVSDKEVSEFVNKVICNIHEEVLVKYAHPQCQHWCGNKTAPGHVGRHPGVPMHIQSSRKEWQHCGMFWHLLQFTMKVTRSTAPSSTAAPLSSPALVALSQGNTQSAKPPLTLTTQAMPTSQYTFSTALWVAMQAAAYPPPLESLGPQLAVCPTSHRGPGAVAMKWSWLKM